VGNEANAKRDMFGRNNGARFGHLREVGVKGFLPAIEHEERDVWVVVHLYEPSLDRCRSVDETLARLARIYPDTKFLRAQASALGFASKAASSSSREHVTQYRLKPSNIRSRYDDEVDPYDDGSESLEGESFVHEDDEENEAGTANVDTDVIPTMLVYRDGELVHNWVRVDWVAGRASLEELLSTHHIIGGSIFGSTPTDDDLLWSDDDEKT